MKFNEWIKFFDGCNNVEYSINAKGKNKATLKGVGLSKGIFGPFKTTDKNQFIEGIKSIDKNVIKSEISLDAGHLNIEEESTNMSTILLSIITSNTFIIKGKKKTSEIFK